MPRPPLLIFAPGCPPPPTSLGRTADALRVAGQRLSFDEARAPRLVIERGPPAATLPPDVREPLPPLDALLEPFELAQLRADIRRDLAAMRGDAAGPPAKILDLDAARAGRGGE